MASVTKYAGTISQTTGGKFREFNNLNNIKNNSDGSWATSNGNIRGKSGSPNRPSTVTLKNFGFNIPVGAEVTKVTVTYRHKKTGTGGHVCNIPAPKITLLGTGDNTFSVKGSAPTTSMVTHNYNCTTKKITRSQVNSSNFGVKIDYPTNTNSYEGTVSISYVRVTVEYVKSQYSINLKKADGGYNGDDYILQMNITNKNLTNYNPTLTLTTPAGFVYKSFEGDGTITKVNERTFTWNPKITNKTGTRSVNLTFGTNVTFPTGVDTFTGDFVVAESLYGTTKTHTATIQKKPPEVIDEEEPDSNNINVETQDQYRHNQCTVGEEFDFTFTLTDEEYEQIFNSIGQQVFLDGSNFQIKFGSTWYDLNQTGFADSAFDENHSVTRPLRAKTVATSTIEMSYTEAAPPYDEITLATFTFEVRPEESDLTITDFSYLQLEQEELDRLGDGFTYIVQAYLNHTTTDTYVRDWYKNNRILVFNNCIEANVTVTTETIDGEVVETVTDSTDYSSLTPTDIFENAEYISPALSEVNEYDNVECEFTYNKDYPLYILITGDYPEAEDDYNFDIGTLTFTEPCIIEKNVYREREVNGNFPAPILDLIDYEASEDSASIILGSYESGSSVVLYDLPLDEGYGTNENYAIRGVQVRATIEATDNLVVYAKLKTPTGNTGQRSIVLDDMYDTVDSDNELVIGGLGDLWGFNTLDMVELEDWEIELSATNLLSNEDSTLNFSDVKVIFFVEKVKKQHITVKIEDENLAYYGAFIENVNIPEGLETDTSFITIDGTDTNDAYRQNIREKTIELDFSINDCDLQTNTDMLRQITKLIVNDKDEYNRPIPKRIEFSHYPYDYFEYIIEDAFDVTEEMGGYTVKCKLTVPAGTSYSKEDTVTNTVGYVQGLAAIRPVISFKPSDAIINITERISEQSFNMGFSGDWNSKVVIIDCDNRKVYLATDEDDPNPVDISSYVDHNVDWFRLHGEFSFETTNCTIRTVTYNERW